MNVVVIIFVYTTNHMDVECQGSDGHYIILYIYRALIELSTIFMVCLPSTAFQMFFWLRPFYCTVSHQYEEEPPHSRSTHWGAYRSVRHSFSVVIVNHIPSWPYIPNITHSRQVEVWWLCMFLMVHMCCFLCTCHIGMTVHTLAFFTSWGLL